MRRSARAEEDLIDIWTYIAIHNQVAADRLLDRLAERWELLVTQPRSGALRSDLGNAIRHVVIGSYVTYYRTDGDEVEILRVFHGHRDITADDLAP